MRVSLSDEAQGDAVAAVDWYIGEGAFIAADDFAVNSIKRFAS
ncbi:MAG: hypothetical protein Q7R45_07570 [Sulfuricaulis sp.]|nr:hypothetical protein [Sulfuricaulis sp.]